MRESSRSASVILGVRQGGRKRANALQRFNVASGRSDVSEFTASRTHFADFPYRLGSEEAYSLTPKFCHYHLHIWSSRSRAIGFPGGIGGAMREPGGINEIYSTTCLRVYPIPPFENTCPSGKTIEKDGTEPNATDKPDPRTSCVLAAAF